MSVAELKQLVHERVDRLQEPAVLQELLTRLEQLESEAAEKTYDLSRHYEAISRERASLLQKLAQ